MSRTRYNEKDWEKNTFCPNCDIMVCLSNDCKNAGKCISCGKKSCGRKTTWGCYINKRGLCEECIEDEDSSPPPTPKTPKIPLVSEQKLRADRKWAAGRILFGTDLKLLTYLRAEKDLHQDYIKYSLQNESMTAYVQRLRPSCKYFNSHIEILATAMLYDKNVLMKLQEITATYFDGDEIKNQ